MSEQEERRDIYKDGYENRVSNERQGYHNAGQVAIPTTSRSDDAAQSHTHTAYPLQLPHAARLPAGTDDRKARDTGYEQSGTQATWNPSLQSIYLTSDGPYQGSAGGNLRITIKTQTDLVNACISTYFVFDNSIRVLAVTERQNFVNSNYHYHLTATIPQLRPTDQAMSLMVDFVDENLYLLDQKQAGWFFYGNHDYVPQAPGNSKRKPTQESFPALASDRFSKRSMSQPSQLLRDENSSSVQTAYPIGLQMGATYSNATYATPSLEPPIVSRAAYAEPIFARTSGLSFSSIPVAALPSPRSGSYGNTNPYSSFTPSAAPSATIRSPHVGRRAVTASPKVRSISSTSTPTWVRTSELRQQQASPRANVAGMTATFNPYSQYPDTKAKLNIVGDLDSMCHGWTSQERNSRRRLVEFERSQSGSTITASFKPVTPEDRNTSNPCVSCIWWARNKTHYVTSVDTIALLEGLVAVHFTVEEKNRIRRNLEGFKPLTVSKNKEESDDAFRLIMGFGNPKPRNIEKDIKVFPWPILKVALRKIIGKYSSSYASTSGAIGQSSGPSSAHTPTYMEIADPRKTPTSSSSTLNEVSEAGSVTSTALSPIRVPTSTSVQVTSPTHAQDLRTSSSLPQMYGQASGDHWPVGTGPANYPSYATTLSHSAPNQSWNLDSYYSQHVGNVYGAAEAGIHQPDATRQYRGYDSRTGGFAPPGGPSVPDGSHRYDEQPPRS